MHKKFVSIAQPEKIGFAFDTDAWTSKAQTCTKFRVFETYGDGLTQHSGDVPVSFELLADYLASLTQAMLKDDDLCDRAAWEFERGPSDEALRFAATLKYRETDREYGKRRYWSAKLQKVGSSQNLEYDKRYQQFAEWMDGSASSILGVVMSDHEYADGWMRYTYTERVRSWGLAQPDETKRRNTYWLDLPALHMKVLTDHEAARNLHAAYEMATNCVQGFHLRKHAAGQLDCYKHNTNAPEKRKAAEEETAA